MDAKQFESKVTPHPPQSRVPWQPWEMGRRVLHEESQALAELAAALASGQARLAAPFAESVKLIRECRGRVVVTGIGKAGIIGQKIAATLASTGTNAHFVHAAEAVHGDLGRFAENDVALVLSFSGETEEIVRLLPFFQQVPLPVIALTGRSDSSLARASQVVLAMGTLAEACPLGLAPSTSTTCMLALGDALALTVSQSKGFGAEGFARFHPGGSLGRKLARVTEIMRAIHDCRTARLDESVRAALVRESRPGRRSGAILVVDADGFLRGLFTDSDLARLLERQRDEALDSPMRLVMTPSPHTIPCEARLEQAVQLMARFKISELPVVDSAQRPLGLLDITDMVELFPMELPDAVTPPAAATPLQWKRAS